MSTLDLADSDAIGTALALTVQVPTGTRAYRVVVAKAASEATTVRGSATSVACGARLAAWITRTSPLPLRGAVRLSRSTMPCRCAFVPTAATV